MLDTTEQRPLIGDCLLKRSGEQDVVTVAARCKTLYKWLVTHMIA